MHNEKTMRVMDDMCDTLEKEIVEAAEMFMKMPTYDNLKAYRKLLEAYAMTCEMKHGKMGDEWHVDATMKPGAPMR